MVTGGCLCGAVTFAVEDFNSGVFKCHCSKCRKAFGGASSAAALVAEGKFSWRQGRDNIRQYQTDSGFKRCFCDNCGSILPQALPDYQAWWVPVGLLDADPGLKLTQHIHTASMAAWEVLDDHTRRREEGF